jgi:hypothetical protein
MSIKQRTRIFVLLSLFVHISSLAQNGEEVGFLDLTNAERSENLLLKDKIALARGSNITPVPAFRMEILPLDRMDLNSGDILEFEIRLTNISKIKQEIPWETNWEKILGDKNGFPEGYLYASISLKAFKSSKKNIREEDERYKLLLVEHIWGCNQSGTFKSLNPGQSVRIKAATTQLGRLNELGEWMISAEIYFGFGLDTASFEETITSNTIGITIRNIDK